MKIAIFRLLGMSLFLLGCTDHDAYISIENQSSAPITAVSIRYETTQHRDVIGTIEPHSSYRYRVDDRFQETAVYLSYIDQYQQHIEQVAIGYAAKYDPVNIKIVIE